jgi:hypothetical protein
MKFLTIRSSFTNTHGGVMSIIRTAVVLASLVFFAGCYHATIETGLVPSTTVINESFASCWVYGLVPPSTVATASKCPDGVAIVETQQSFVNGLVGILTFGIYTPMDIRVTCAAKTSASLHGQEPDFVLPEGASVEDILKLYMKAADITVATKKPVIIAY